MVMVKVMVVVMFMVVMMMTMVMMVSPQQPGTDQVNDETNERDQNGLTIVNLARREQTFH